MFTGVIGYIWYIDILLLGIALIMSLNIIILALINKYYRWEQERAIRRLKTSLQENRQDGKGNYLSQVDTVGILALARKEQMLVGRERENFRAYLDKYMNAGKVRRAASSATAKWEQIEAILLLGYAHDYEAHRLLQKNLDNQDQDIVYFTCQSLALLQTPQSASILLEFIAKRAFSAHRISQFLETYPRNIIPVLIDYAADVDPLIRYWCIKLLTRFQAREAIISIGNMSRDSSADVRAAVSEYIGQLGTIAQAEILIPLLTDRVWFVRMQAVRGLMKLSGGNCLEDVAKLITDPSPLVKEAVKDIMAKNIAAAIPYIGKVLSGDDHGAKKYCAEALVQANYIPEILRQALNKNDYRCTQARDIINGLVKANLYFGLKQALSLFTTRRGELLELVAQGNPVLADLLEQGTVK